MTNTERDATAAICLFAAMADGGIGPEEQGRVQAAIQSIAAGGAGPSGDVYQRVVLGQTDVAREAAAIGTPEAKRQAYELAVAVCAADGATSEVERAFLSRLAALLGVEDGHAQSVVNQADQMASVPPIPGAGAATGPAGAGSRPSDAEINEMITSAAVVNGALELLPHTLASMAIIPLQMRLVYRIGAKYRYTLDRSHIAEFLGVLGVGATSQVIESVASRLIGGLFGGIGGQVVGRTLGGFAGAVGRTAGGAAVSFASTYALGQVAKQYYAGGRSLGAIDLKSLFTTNLDAARGVFGRYVPEIESRARNLNPGQLLSLAKGELGV